MLERRIPKFSRGEDWSEYERRVLGLPGNTIATNEDRRRATEESKAKEEARKND
jgi:hypothetical protein